MSNNNTDTKENALVVRSPEFVYASEDGQQRHYDIIVASKPQGDLATRMTPFYQIEKHETYDGVAYIGRIFHTFDDGKDIFSQRGSVLLNESGRPLPLIVNGKRIQPKIFDDIDGGIHLGAKLMTRTHEISYSIKPDGTIEGMNYRFPHRNAEVIDQYSGQTEIEGVGLTEQALILAMHEAMEEDRQRSKQFPLACYIKHKKGGKK